MAQNNKILLVEGDADKSFFEALCKQQMLQTTVKVSVSKGLGGDYNTKGGIVNLLPTYLPNLIDMEGGRLGVVVDADCVEHGSGYAATLEQITQAVAPFGYELHQSPTHKLGDGLIYKHTNGLADLGLWIMPNNKDEGSLEHWIKHCITPTEQALFSHASNVIDGLPKPVKFKLLRRPKAEVSSWLAWQTSPGRGLYATVTDDLLGACRT